MFPKEKQQVALDKFVDFVDYIFDQNARFLGPVVKKKESEIVALKTEWVETLRNHDAEPEVRFLSVARSAGQNNMKIASAVLIQLMDVCIQDVEFYKELDLTDRDKEVVKHHLYHYFEKMKEEGLINPNDETLLKLMNKAFANNLRAFQQKE